MGPAGAGDLCGVESLKSRNTTAGSLQRAAREGVRSSSIFSVGVVWSFSCWALLSSARRCPGVLGYCAAGALLPLRLKLSRSRLSASSALYPSRWLASSAPGRASLELLVDCGVVDARGPRCRPADLRADATPRPSSCPRRSGSGTFPSVSPPSYGVVVKKKRTADSLESLCV